MPEKSIQARWLYTADGWRKKPVVEVNNEGRISSIHEQKHPGAERTAGNAARDLVLLPGFVNAHSHAFQYGLRGKTQEAGSFDDWVNRFLYPHLRDLSKEEIVSVSRRAFEEMAKKGITCVGEFHYIHNESDGEKLGNEIDRAVLEAARDVGLRIGFIRAFYDRSGPEARKRFLESPEACREHYQALADDYEDDAMVNVLPGPHSVHGASPDALRTGAELAEEREVPFHVHISEQVGEVQERRNNYGASPLTYLKDQGILNEWLVGVHGCWLSEEEISLLAGEGRGLVSCPTTNLTLGDGTSPLRNLMESGGEFALGTDAHQRVDMLEEARLAEWLQRLQALRMNILSDGKSLPAYLLEAATRKGAKMLGFESGRIEEGRPADLIGVPFSVIDGPGEDPEQPPSLEKLIFTQSASSSISHVWVGGKPIVCPNKKDASIE